MSIQFHIRPATVADVVRICVLDVSDAHDHILAGRAPSACPRSRMTTAIPLTRFDRRFRRPRTRKNQSPQRLPPSWCAQPCLPLSAATHPLQFRENIFEKGYAHALLAFQGTAENPGPPLGMALYFFNFSTWTGRPGLFVRLAHTCYVHV